MTQGTLLITGSSRGIGLELTRQYLEAGWRVHATCRHPEQSLALTQLAAGGHGGRLSLHPLDVTDWHQIMGLQAVLRGQPLDLLINNAGALGPKMQGLGEIHPDAWLETLRVNSIAPLILLEALVDNLAAGQRRIVANLSSKMGSIEDNRSGGYYIYRSSKAALNAAMRSAALDLAQRGITVVLLHPGWVRTRMGGPQAELEVADSVAHMRQVLDRIGPRDTGRFIDLDGSDIPW